MNTKTSSELMHDIINDLTIINAANLKIQKNLTQATIVQAKTELIDQSLNMVFKNMGLLRSLLIKKTAQQEML